MPVRPRQPRSEIHEGLGADGLASEESGSGGVAECDPVAALMRRVIERLDRRLDAEQRRHLAAAMPAVLWEFPDAGTRVQLVATPTSLTCVTDGDAPPLVVRMPLASLEDAAFGRRSLAAAFLAGRITVRGMSPSRLREFILLVNPLLDSFREAALERSVPGTPPSHVP